MSIGLGGGGFMIWLDDGLGKVFSITAGEANDGAWLLTTPAFMEHLGSLREDLAFFPLEYPAGGVGPGSYSIAYFVKRTV